MNRRISSIVHYLCKLLYNLTLRPILLFLHCKLEIRIPIITFTTLSYVIELVEGMLRKILQNMPSVNVFFVKFARFEVDERSGVVRTRGTDLFQLDMEYVLYVKAEDQNGKVDDRRFQSTPEERLSIVGGKRAPQFYMPSYEAEIPENQKKDSE